jgi:GTP-sensing pleiotropic transcriptional regulator CodY
MSNSIAAAKKRRAGIQPPNPATPTTQVGGPTSQNGAPALTLPQVIALVDKRLTKLEDSVKAGSNTNANTNTNTSDAPPSNVVAEYMEEMDRKFELLAEEITNMKDIVLKLQSFTMDVNKTLMEERVRILSDFQSQDMGVEVDESMEASNKNEMETQAVVDEAIEEK